MSEPSRFDEEISKAWKIAGRDLGVRVVAPFEFTVEGGKAAIVEAYVPNFGRPKGAVALSNATSHYARSLSGLGYFTSILFPSYRSYSRDHFIGTLNDWQWFGNPDEKPDWCSGKPWS
jgi:hypothetical protein